MKPINEETDHLNRLVGNLLDMSRIEAGALNPAPPVERALRNPGKRPAAHPPYAQDYRIEIDIPEDLPLVPVDFMQIDRVFVNLVSNSAKYAPVGTVIQIYCPSARSPFL